MASRSGRMTAGQRVNYSNANSLTRLLSPVSLPGPLRGTLFSPELFIDDGRLWHPDPDPGAALTIGGRWARVEVHPRPIFARTKPPWAYKGIPIGLQSPYGVKFESPLNVVKCVRRKVRRSVIFALNKTGKGARSRNRRRDQYTKVGC